MASSKVVAPEKSASVYIKCKKCLRLMKSDSSLIESKQFSFPEAGEERFSDFEESGQAIQTFVEATDSDISKKLVLPQNYMKCGDTCMKVGLSDFKDDVGESYNDGMGLAAAQPDVGFALPDISHPLCDKCAGNLLKWRFEELGVAEDELEVHSHFLKHFEDSVSLENLEPLEREIEMLKEEQGQLEEELFELKEQEKAMTEVLFKQGKLRKEITEEEKMLYETCNDMQYMLLKCYNELQVVKNMSQTAMDHFKKVEELSWDGAFDIVFSDSICTINNFRLCRLPNVHVEWQEINAALGQAVLLLHLLAKKIGLKFERYQPVPCGNHSYMVSLNNNVKLPLHSSRVLRPFRDCKFDKAMVGFLDCLQQLKEEIENADFSIFMPFRIHQDKIFDEADEKGYSVKLLFNSKVMWTEGMRLVMLNLKAGMDWVTSQFNKDPTL